MLLSFRYGAPPYGGIAPGIDRVMLLAGVENLREAVAFREPASRGRLMRTG